MDSFSRSVVCLADSVAFWQHPFMKDTGDQDSAALPPVEQNMLAMLMTMQAGTDVITVPA
ncbi:MAG: hypothetical protein WCC32_03050 [Terriglobales bacterium]